ncbi:peroxiredoxin Q/BCP [Neomicrococcus aestuarii]|uniref:thioredoxin-dependent peroxiredoxin n=1 Tax=Neomicrococcus aestuarii TaxID=556325 RepID=A0A7W8WYL7_9MICC|nr:thioredoxin-dependent thiol peroxidase [Neomicrococcus aestuarii]MBB5511327.1 peroxiredoxin Q/BCP [Neomicrococcus aestuarii]
MTQASAAPTGHRFTVGQEAPDFQIQDHQGNTVSKQSLLGTRYVLYFYPAANTPACNQQACDFRDHVEDFGTQGLPVYGVSPDSVETLSKFAAKHELNFTVLADPEHEASVAFGTWGEKKNYGRTYEGLIRSTFVINEQGAFDLAQYNVRAKGHVEKLLRDLQNLG